MAYNAEKVVKYPKSLLISNFSPKTKRHSNIKAKHKMNTIKKCRIFFWYIFKIKVPRY